MAGPLRIAVIETRSSGTHVFARIPLPRLGSVLLGTYLDRLGAHVRVFCEDVAPIDTEFLRDCDAVLLSTITATTQRAYALNRQIKADRPAVKTVIGGPHATFLPEEALCEAGFDYVFRGEVDTAVEELFGLLEGSIAPEQVPNLSYLEAGQVRHNPQRPMVNNLDEIPCTNLSLVEGRFRIHITPMAFSRGCPYSCDFCSVVEMFGHHFRHQSKEAALNQLTHKQRTEAALGMHPTPLFVYDDNHTANRKWAKELWDEALRRGLAPRRMYLQTRVDVTRDPELMELLRRANCRRMYWGIESVDDETLEEMGKRQKIAEVEEAIRVAHRYGIAIHGMFVVGFSRDTEQTVRQIVGFANKTNLDTFQAMVLTPLPGTPFFRRVFQEGRVFDTNWDHYDGQHIVFSPQSMAPLSLQRQIVWAMERFYSLGRCARRVLRLRLADASITFWGWRAVRQWPRLPEKRRFFEFLRRYEAGFGTQQSAVSSAPAGR